MTTADDGATIGSRVAFWRERIRQIGLRRFLQSELLAADPWPGGSPERSVIVGVLRRLDVRAEDAAWLQVETERTGARPPTPAAIADLVRTARSARDAHRRARREAAASVGPARAERHIGPTFAFVGEGVSAGLRFEGGDAARLEKARLPLLRTPEDLAEALGIGLGVLAWLTYHRSAARTDHYRRFTLPKRTGGVRTIAAPKQQLRAAQRWIHDAILSPVAVLEPAHAFRPGRSIVSNAAAHTDRAVVVRIDLKDFFPSITFGRVKGVFAQLGYSEGIATLLALLATEAPRADVEMEGLGRRWVALGPRRLPQGGCASPALSNIVCRGLDARLAGLAARLEFAYTRYADDLVFSHDRGDAPVGLLLDAARRIVAEEGFTVNEDKTRVLRSAHRQAVTGLVTNGDGKPRIPRPALRRFRALLHQCERDGFAAVSERLGQNARAYAFGYWAFVHQVDPELARRLRAQHPWLRRPSADSA